nr:hypothetical protein [Tanacetum cinerariifolium]GFC77452.1 hypothetical protein [Tanacetum cinerariifolium]
TGPTWLFDIDSLTKTMNYQPVTTRNQTNPSAVFQDTFDVDKAGKEANLQYVLFPLWSTGFLNPQNKEGDTAFAEKEHDAEKPKSEVNLSPSKRNQTNPSVGFQDKFDAEKVREEIDQQYILFLVWSSGSSNPQNNDGDAAFDEKEHDFDAKKPESEVIVSPSSSAQLRKQDDKTMKEA